MQIYFASYATGFAGSMRSLNALNSIDNNQNTVWNIGAYLPITEYGIASLVGQWWS